MDFSKPTKVFALPAAEGAVGTAAAAIATRPITAARLTTPVTIAARTVDDLRLRAEPLRRGRGGEFLGNKARSFQWNVLCCRAVRITNVGGRPIPFVHPNFVPTDVVAQTHLRQQPFEGIVTDLDCSRMLLALDSLA